MKRHRGQMPVIEAFTGAILIFTALIISSYILTVERPSITVGTSLKQNLDQVLQALGRSGKLREALYYRGTAPNITYLYQLIEDALSGVAPNAKIRVTVYDAYGNPIVGPYGYTPPVDADVAVAYYYEPGSYVQTIRLGGTRTVVGPAAWFEDDYSGYTTLIRDMVWWLHGSLEEIVVAGDCYLYDPSLGGYAYRPFVAVVLWDGSAFTLQAINTLTSPAYASAIHEHVSGVAVRDIDGDGAPEIVTAGYCELSDGTQLAELILWQYDSSTSSIAMLSSYVFSYTDLDPTATGFTANKATDIVFASELGSGVLGPWDDPEATGFDDGDEGERAPRIVTLLQGGNEIYFFDDVEWGNIPGWTGDIATDQWHIVYDPSAAHSPQRYWYSSQQIGAATVTLVSPDIDLTSATSPVFLCFYEQYSLSLFDQLSVDISTDGGNTWSTLYSISGSTSKNTWDPRTEIRLDAYVGNVVKIRFRLSTATSAWWCIDDIVVARGSVTQNRIFYDPVNLTSQTVWQVDSSGRASGDWTVDTTDYAPGSSPYAWHGWYSVGRIPQSGTWELYTKIDISGYDDYRVVFMYKTALSEKGSLTFKTELDGATNYSQPLSSTDWTLHDTGWIATGGATELTVRFVLDLERAQNQAGDVWVDEIEVYARRVTSPSDVRSYGGESCIPRYTVLLVSGYGTASDGSDYGWVLGVGVESSGLLIPLVNQTFSKEIGDILPDGSSESQVLTYNLTYLLLLGEDRRATSLTAADLGDEDATWDFWHDYSSGEPRVDYVEVGVVATNTTGTPRGLVYILDLRGYGYRADDPSQSYDPENFRSDVDDPDVIVEIVLEARSGSPASASNTYWKGCSQVSDIDGDGFYDLLTVGETQISTPTSNVRCPVVAVYRYYQSVTGWILEAIRGPTALPTSPLTDAPLCAWTWWQDNGVVVICKNVTQLTGARWSYYFDLWDPETDTVVESYLWDSRYTTGGIGGRDLIVASMLPDGTNPGLVGIVGGAIWNATVGAEHWDFYLATLDLFEVDVPPEYETTFIYEPRVIRVEAWLE